LRALEIKLTALPDEQTHSLPENKYGSEIVVRPDTIVYLALSIASTYQSERNTLLSIMGPVCSTIQDWENPKEVQSLILDMISIIDGILLDKLDKQKPLLLQPIWKTIGKSSVLDINCLDIFVWSDFAFTRLFIDASLSKSTYKITRLSRTVIWLIKMLFDFAKNGRFNPKQTIDKLTYNTRNDKAFALGGKSTHQYMVCSELVKPRLTKHIFKNIILGGGQNFLSPERRLDAVILSTSGLFEKERE